MLIRRAWETQPQEPAPLRPEIEQHLSVLALGSEPIFRGCGPVTLAGGITRAPGGAGLAWQGDNTDNVASATPLRDGSLVITKDCYYTMVVVFRKRAAGANTGHIAGYGSSGGSSGNTLHRLVGASDANQVQFQLQTGAGNVLYNTPSASAGINDQGWHVAVVPYQMSVSASDVLTYYIDGVNRGSVTRALGAADTTFNRASVGATIRGGGAVGAGNWDVALYLHLLARMPDEWCQQASTLGTVWDALFEPARAWVPGSAAPGLPTLSLSTYKSGTLTSSGWTPRVTAT